MKAMLVSLTPVSDSAARSAPLRSFSSLLASAPPGPATIGKDDGVDPDYEMDDEDRQNCRNIYNKLVKDKLALDRGFDASIEGIEASFTPEAMATSVDIAISTLRIEAGHLLRHCWKALDSDEKETVRQIGRDLVAKDRRVREAVRAGGGFPFVLPGPFGAPAGIPAGLPAGL